jgi:hypothetical protein
MGVDQGGQRLSRVDEIRRQHATGLRTEVESVVRDPWRDEESVPGPERERGPSGDRHHHRAFQDEADLLPGMDVPT